MSHYPQPHDEPPPLEGSEAPYPGPPLLQQTPYPLAKFQRRFRQLSLQPQSSSKRHRPQCLPVRQPSQQTLSPGRHVLGVMVFIMLAIMVAVIGMQYETTYTSTNDIPPTPTPTPIPHLLSSLEFEQHSLLFAQQSGASGSNLSSYYDSSSWSIAITETIGTTGKSGISARTVLTDCFDIEKALWQHLNIKTVTVNIIGSVSIGIINPIAICTLDESTEQHFNWNILSPGQAWEEYDYTWILPSLLQG
jgi:hypothetical protein